MKEHEEIFTKIIDNLLKFTRNGDIHWNPIRNKNELKFEFIGDDETKYSMKFEWSFGNDGWKLKGGDLNINGKESIFLWDWKWKKLEDLKNILLSTYPFNPDDSNVLKNLRDMADSISKSGNRDNKISEILDLS